MSFFRLPLWKNNVNKKSHVIDMSTGIDQYGEKIEIQSAISLYAMITVIEHIATLISKIEVKVFKKNKENKSYTWYRLNVRPNYNQSSAQFWQAAISELLYTGELLIIPVNDMLVISDGFTQNEYSLLENVFTNISLPGNNNFTLDRSYNISEVFYIKYSNSDVQTYLQSVIGSLENLHKEAINKYMTSRGNKGFIEISSVAQGDKDFEKKYADVFNKKLKNFFNAKNAVAPLFNGWDYKSIGNETSRYTNEVADIKAIFDDALIRAAQTFKFPPALIKGDVAGIDDAFEYMLTVCIAPLLNVISEELTGKWYTPREVIEGNYIEADTTSIRHVDIFKMAGNIEKLLGSAFVSVNEARDKAGLKRINEKWADEYQMTKNHELLRNITNGED